VSALPGAPRGTINMDPMAVTGLVDDINGEHSFTVNGVPHEMAHLRQTAAVLASLLQREGGAQASLISKPSTLPARRGSPT
jgi:hypothetical protein